MMVARGSWIVSSGERLRHKLVVHTVKGTDGALASIVLLPGDARRMDGFYNHHADQLGEGKSLRRCSKQCAGARTPMRREYSTITGLIALPGA